MKTLRIGALVLLAGLSASVSESDLCACASAAREGEEVRIAEESAVIVWDAANSTQHFIRRARFDTKAKDFGFLVPTPSVPILAESDEAVFGLLEDIAFGGVKALLKNAKSKKMTLPDEALAAQVVVIATAKVAGLDATVLEATDAGALDTWLKAHGYVSSPALVAWYRPYIERRWKITAFKIAADSARTHAARSSAVRMTFRTEKPFFPYREPATAAGAKPSSRSLSLYFIGDSRVDGRLGESGAWPGKTVWSRTLSYWQRRALDKRLGIPAAQTGPMTRMTAFLDHSSPRPGKDDVYFSASADQTEEGLEAPTPIWWSDPDPLLAIGIFVLFLAGLLIGGAWLNRART